MKKKSNLTKKIEHFFDKLATICGGYAEMGVMAMVSIIGGMSLFLVLIEADKIVIFMTTILIFVFACLGKKLISK